MSKELLQVTSAGSWWSSGWLWFFVVCLVIVAIGLMRWTWTPPRRR